MPTTCDAYHPELAVSGGCFVLAESAVAMDVDVAWPSALETSSRILATSIALV